MHKKLNSITDNMQVTVQVPYKMTIKIYYYYAHYITMST